jgi:multiple sugar transport system permease protein
MITRLKQVLHARKMKWIDIPIWLAGLLFALFWIAPFIWMVSTSFKPVKDVMTPYVEWFPRTIVLSNYQKVFESPVAMWALNSLIVAVTATAFGVGLGALAGYGLARLHFPGRNLLFGLLLASLMIPTEMSIIPLFIAFLKVGLIDNYPAIILPSIASVISVYIFRQFFMTIPQELEDAAAIDGANRFQIFTRVALPLARAPAIAATILLFTTNWNAFLWPLLITFTGRMKTMPVGLAQYAPVIGSNTQIEGFGPAMAGVTLLTIPSVVIFILLQNYFIEGVTRSGIKG